jgi:hypothetical protein
MADVNEKKSEDRKTIGVWGVLWRAVALFSLPVPILLLLKWWLNW